MSGVSTPSLRLSRTTTDVGHAGGVEHAHSRRVNVLGVARSLAGFHVSTTGRFWVSTKAILPSMPRRALPQPVELIHPQPAKPSTATAGCSTRNSTTAGGSSRSRTVRASGS
jgi:hypothetical protein